MLAITYLLLATFAAWATAKPSLPVNYDECPEDLKPVFVANTFRFAVSAQTFFNATGSFFDSEWYTGPLLCTTGHDDTIGATRTANFSGTIYRERLIDFSRTPDRLLQRFTLDNGPITVGDLALTHTEEIVVQSICNGAAVWASFTDKLCASNTTEAYNLYSRSRILLVDSLAAGIGALYADGSCPT
ncbi:hypothetical protein C0992_009737 [Termitomyces sp. T32_za158]|nr:hypothetical protein C0992_009737 [Termitomyces sp. T32_za158]